MLGNFSYHNPTKLYFGDESLNYLKDELAKRDELLGLLACFRDFPLEIPLAHCVRGGMVRTIFFPLFP
ncbi:MAG: hypothetical protein SPL42_05370 [Bacteroidales bacterium]|nr:hypothetical protein [Bacteroidales bacterium]MDY6347844.1 hypothetical protein [Bacteroidales bacterium]